MSRDSSLAHREYSAAFLQIQILYLQKNSVYTNTDNSREHYSICYLWYSWGVSTLQSHPISLHFFPSKIFATYFSVIYLSSDELSWLERGANDAEAAKLSLL